MSDKTRQVFQVVVDSALSGEDTRRLLEQLIDVGLADAVRTLSAEKLIDAGLVDAAFILEDLGNHPEGSPMVALARDALDLDIHSPEEVFFVLDADREMIPAELVETKEEMTAARGAEGPAGP